MNVSQGKYSIRSGKAPRTTSEGQSVAVPERAPNHSGTSSHNGSADQVALAIVRGLYEGSYVAGQQLVEPDLMRRYGVSRGTVREALRRLTAEGLVTASLYRGARIRFLTRGDVRDMLEIISALAGLSARLAAERIHREVDEEALRGTLKRLLILAPAEAPFELARERGRLYRQLAHFSGNRELARLVPLLQAHLIRVQFGKGHSPGSEHKMIEDYIAIVDAVLKHDGVRAEQALRDHIRGVAEAIEKLPDDFFAV